MLDDNSIQGDLGRKRNIPGSDSIHRLYSKKKSCLKFPTQTANFNNNERFNKFNYKIEQNF